MSEPVICCAMCGERVEMCVRYRECYENRIVPALVAERDEALAALSEAPPWAPQGFKAECEAIADLFNANEFVDDESVERPLREAVAEVFGVLGAHRKGMTQALAKAEGMQAAVVRFLREKCFGMENVADAIEQGKHLVQLPSSPGGGR